MSQILTDRAGGALLRLFIEVIEVVEATLVGPARLALIGPKPVTTALANAWELAVKRDEIDNAIRQSVEDNRLTRVADYLGQLVEQGRLEDLKLRHHGGLRGMNDMRDCQVVVVLPGWPDIRDAEQEAKALGIDPQDHIQGLHEAQLEQALTRVRPLDATPVDPRILTLVGRQPLSAWEDLEYEIVNLPGGGRVKQGPRRSAERLADQCLEHHSAVSGPLLRKIFDHKALRSNLLPGASYWDLRVVADANTRTVRRGVRNVADELPAQPLTSPFGGTTWKFYEREAGAARKLRDLVEGLIAGPDTTATGDLCSSSSVRSVDVQPTFKGSRRGQLELIGPVSAS